MKPPFEVPRYDQSDFWKLIVCLVILSVVLFGCGGTPPKPIPPPVQPFPFYNGFLGLACTESVPPKCVDDGKPWATFDRPGTQGQDCIIPGNCYLVNNRGLNINIDEPGFPMMLRQKLDHTKRIGVSMTVTATCRTLTCYIGPVLYNGEGIPPSPFGAYRALYIDASGISMYGPYFAKRLMPATPGATYTLGIEYEAGNWWYKVNGAVMLVETPGSLSADPTLLSHDPMPSIWAGSVDAVVTGFAVQ